jgi:hypothetical protein
VLEMLGFATREQRERCGLPAAPSLFRVLCDQCELTVLLRVGRAFEVQGALLLLALLLLLDQGPHGLLSAGGELHGPTTVPGGPLATPSDAILTRCSLIVLAVLELLLTSGCLRRVACPGCECKGTRRQCRGPAAGRILVLVVAMSCHLLAVEAASFTTKNIGQSTPAARLDNTISVTIAASFDLANGEKVTVSGLTGSQTTTNAQLTVDASSCNKLGTAGAWTQSTGVLVMTVANGPLTAGAL